MTDKGYPAEIRTLPLVVATLITGAVVLLLGGVLAWANREHWHWYTIDPDAVSAVENELQREIGALESEVAILETKLAEAGEMIDGLSSEVETLPRREPSIGDFYPTSR